MTTSRQTSPRFTPETLASYLSAPAPTRMTVGTSDTCELLIDPAVSELRLECAVPGALPDLAAFDNIDCEVDENQPDRDLRVVTVDATDHPHEGYSFLLSIVDAIDHGLPFKRAVEQSIGAYRELLSRVRALSVEQQIGLFGELLVLEHLASTLGPLAAARTWLGPQGEEHDFVLDNVDLEVKTTRGEAREHRITGPMQLARTGERPLYLVSIQVTGGGKATEGESLADRVGAARLALGEHSRVLDDVLESVGWDATTAAEIYGKQRWMLRTRPAAFAVDDEFPAITSDMIASVVRHSERVRGFTYVVDLGGIEPSPAPDAVRGFCC